MKITNITMAVSALTLVGILAGAGAAQEAPQQQAPATAPAPAGPMASCPMAVPGTRVSVNDTRDGVALAFTTKSGDLRDLRQRVQMMAHHYEVHAGKGMMQWQSMHGGMGQSHGMGGQGQGQGMEQHMGASSMPRVRTRVENLPGGARVILTPVDPSTLAALRTRVRHDAERMRSGQCWTRKTPPNE